MNKNRWRILAVVVVLAFLIPVAYGYLHGLNFAVLNPKGQVAVQERSLMATTVVLGLIVIIPVYLMLFGFAWQYRAGNKKATYSPKLQGNTFLELAWWGIPLAIITSLSVVTWHSSHTLDPRQRLVASTPPLNVQVIALDWKWLFLYPDQHIASLNYLMMPVGKPVSFSITADAPMNSFWIPQLGSQIYAMPGMSTKLNLIADSAGDYAGSSANISGDGFADMRFTAHATSEADFQRWVQTAQHTSAKLDTKTYQQLTKPSEKNAKQLYRNVDPSLYNQVLLKYMVPTGENYAR